MVTPRHIAARLTPLVLCLLTSIRPSLASTLSYTGDLRTNANITSCGPSCTLGASNSNGDYAQYAAVVVNFSVLAPSSMSAVSFGYGGGVNGAGTVIPQGGLEPYLSLFNPAGTFLASTFPAASLCPPGARTNTLSGLCYDVRLNGGVLLPGTYELALTAFDNLSFAENLGTGTLADGFTGLGNLYPGEDLHYAFDVTLSPAVPTVTPEPPPFVLVGLSSLLGAAANLIRRRSTAHAERT